MKRERKKRSATEDEFHWLGEGVEGQGSLFLELDPYVFCADQELCQRVKALAFEVDPIDLKPSLVLCPPAESLGFQLGLFSEQYQVSVRDGGDDELTAEVLARFRVLDLEGELPMKRQGQIQSVVYTDYLWDSPQECAQAIRKCCGMLSNDGVASFLLPGALLGTEVSAVWSSGATTSLDKIIRGEVFGFPLPFEHRAVPFASVSSEEMEYVRRFLKRHRDYFGRAALGSCLQRMKDIDFLGMFSGEGSQLRCSILLEFSATECFASDRGL